MRLRFRAWHYVLSSVVGSFGAAAIAIVAVVVLDKGVTGFFIGLICGNAIATLYGLYAVRHDLRARYDISELRTMLAYGLPLVPAALALWALALVDRILLRHLDTLDSVGEYAVANRVANVLLLVVSGFSLAFGPYIFSIYSEDRATERQVRAQTLRYLAIVLCAIGLALTLFAHALIDVVAPSFDTAYEAVGPLALGAVAVGISAVAMSGISYVRRTELLAGAAVLAAVVNIGLNFALIPPFGMVGAAFATAAAYLLLATIQYVLAQRLYPTPYEPAKVLTTLALASAFGVLGVVPLHPLALELAVKTLALAAFLVTLRLSGAIDGQDVLKLRDLAGRIRGVRPVQA
jgi:O-antigen/teichoic acid export membrane protein